MDQPSRPRRVSDYSWSSLSLSSLPFDMAANQPRPVAALGPPRPPPAAAPRHEAPPLAANPANRVSPVSDIAAVTTEGDTAFYLHRVCRHFARKKDIVEIALALDPQAIRRRAEPKASTNGEKLLIRKEQYSYPLNIALQNGASTEVLELLVNRGKDVLLKKDGQEQTGSLSVALTHSPRDLDLIELIMFSNLPSLMVTDRKLNYPLHVACAKGASAAVLERLYSHYPAALFEKNFNGETPLDVARRSSTIDEDALNFVYERYHQGCVLLAQNSSRRNLFARFTNAPRAA